MRAKRPGTVEIIDTRDHAVGKRPFDRAHRETGNIGPVGDPLLARLGVGPGNAAALGIAHHDDGKLFARNLAVGLHLALTIDARDEQRIAQHEVRHRNDRLTHARITRGKPDEFR